MYDMALVITGIILLALSVVLAFVPVRWSAPVAWCGLLLGGGRSHCPGYKLSAAV